MLFNHTTFKNPILTRSLSFKPKNDAIPSQQALHTQTHLSIGQKNFLRKAHKQNNRPIEIEVPSLVGVGKGWSHIGNF